MARVSEAARTRWIRPIPNLLTVLRIGAAFVLPVVPTVWRLPLVLFAGVSDWLDGVIARRFHVTTRSGALLDGIADKAFVLAAAITFVRAGDISWWQAVAVMARDLAVAGMAGICVLRGAWGAFAHMEARRPGKLTTALVLPWFAALLLPVGDTVRMVCFVLAAGASVVAAVDYAAQFVQKTRAGALDSRGAEDVT